MGKIGNHSVQRIKTMSKGRAKQKICATIAGVSLALFFISSLSAQPLEKRIIAKFALKDLAGKEHVLKDMKGKIVVLIFGELYQHNTVKALQEMKKILSIKQSYQDTVEVLLIVSEKKNTQDYLKVKEGLEIPFPILLDDQRTVYAQYEIIALPSTFVIDRNGIIVAAIPSYTIAYYDQVDAQLGYLLGEMSKEELDRVLNFQVTVPVIDQTTERYLSLADHLRKRGWYDSAMNSYQEALKNDPASTEAHLGMGMIYLDQKKPDKAGEAFQFVLKNNPDNLGALKGMGQVYLLKGEIDKAEVLLQRVISSNYLDEDILYVMGELYEKKGNHKEAMRYYKKNCQQLLREK
jgi:tetratricopeptide (TPR) repeat protein